MTARRPRRGAGQVIGLIVALLGLIGGGALLSIAQRRSADTVDRFARAPIGCTTTLSFSETGTFYVYEETVDDLNGLVDECLPVADPSLDFEVEFTGDLQPETVDADTGLDYEVDGFTGQSLQRIVIRELGEYDVSVSGGDVDVVAAIGGPAAEGVDQLRLLALMAAIAGVVLGLLLVMVSARRSRRAAEAAVDVETDESDASPSGLDEQPTWPPQAPRIPVSAVGSWTPPRPPPTPPPPTPAAPAGRAMSDPVGDADWAPPSGDPRPHLPPPPPFGDDT